MKAIAAFLILTLSCFAQPMGEREAINKSHIDFTREYLFFAIHGKVEIDGHTFINDTCKDPVIFRADIDGVEIFRQSDSTHRVLYVHRKCAEQGCGIVHLTQRPEPVYKSPWQLYQFESVPCVPKPKIFLD